MYPQTPDTRRTDATVLPVHPYTATTHYPVPFEAADLVPAEARRIVGYERYAGDLLVPVYEALPAPVPPQPAVVPRGVDPLAQQLLFGGVGAGAAGAGVGWGFGQALAGIAEIGGTTGVIAVLALLALARAHAGRTTVNNHTTVNNTNRWLGRSTTNTRQG